MIATAAYAVAYPNSDMDGSGILYGTAGGAASGFLNSQHVRNWVATGEFRSFESSWRRHMGGAQYASTYSLDPASETFDIARLQEMRRIEYLDKLVDAGLINRGTTFEDICSEHFVELASMEHASIGSWTPNAMGFPAVSYTYPVTSRSKILTATLYHYTTNKVGSFSPSIDYWHGEHSWRHSQVSWATQVRMPAQFFGAGSQGPLDSGGFLRSVGGTKGLWMAFMDRELARLISIRSPHWMPPDILYFKHRHKW